MNKPSGCLPAIIAAVAFFLLLALAGRADYNEEVVSEMGTETYRSIQAELGEGATETDIVETYMDRRDAAAGGQGYCPP